MICHRNQPSSSPCLVLSCLLNPVNDESEETKHDLEVLENCIEPDEGDDYLSRADFMCCTQGLEFAGYARKGDIGG